MFNVKVLHVNHVPHTNEYGIRWLFKPTIIGVTNHWMIVYVFTATYTGNFFLYSFEYRSWIKLHHEFLPKFYHQTFILFQRQYLVVHGTENPDRTIYRTYIGDITQGSTIKFDFAAILETPGMKYGEHRLVNANNVVYVVSGYDITRSKKATVHRFNPRFKIWELIYRADSSLNISRPFYIPPRENCIIHHDEKLYVFPNVRERHVNDFTAFHTILPQRVTVFDLRRNVWTRRPMRLRRTDMPRDPPPARPNERYTVTDEYSLAQCPVHTRYVYVTLSNGSSASGPAWDTWLLDLANKPRWQRLRVVVPGPAMPRPVRFTTAITPGGEMYAVRASEDPDEQRLVFRTQVRCSRRG